jgi:hypothetical protein
VKSTEAASKETRYSSEAIVQIAAKSACSRASHDISLLGASDLFETY